MEQELENIGCQFMPLHVKMRVMAFFSRDNLHLIPAKQIVPLMRIVDFMRGFKDTK